LISINVQRHCEPIQINFVVQNQKWFQYFNKLEENREEDQRVECALEITTVI